MHPLVKSGNLEQLPEELFEEHFRKPIDKFLETSRGTIVLIQPSVRDILSDHPVFPQCELEIVNRFVSCTEPQLLKYLLTSHCPCDRKTGEIYGQYLILVGFQLMVSLLAVLLSMFYYICVTRNSHSGAS